MPWVGHVLIALADRETRLLVIGLPCLIIALMSLGELVGVLRNRRRTTVGSVSVPVGA